MHVDSVLQRFCFGHRAERSTVELFSRGVEDSVLDGFVDLAAGKAWHMHAMANAVLMSQS
jgi:hypothetical protein